MENVTESVKGRIEAARKAWYEAGHKRTPDLYPLVTALRAEGIQVVCTGYRGSKKPAKVTEMHLESRLDSCTFYRMG